MPWNLDLQFWVSPDMHEMMSRAAAAAANVPDEPPMAKRVGKKAGRGVAWLGDDVLVTVRWFRKVPFLGNI